MSERSLGQSKRPATRTHIATVQIAHYTTSFCSRSQLQAMSTENSAYM